MTRIQSLIRLTSDFGFSYGVGTQWRLDVVLGLQHYHVVDQPTLDTALNLLVRQMVPMLEAMSQYSSPQSQHDILIALHNTADDPIPVNFIPQGQRIKTDGI